MTSEASSLPGDQPNLVAELAAEFLDAVHAGKNPRSEDFLRRAGAEAEQLRPLLSMMLSLETVRDVAVSPVLSQTSSSPMPAKLGDYQLVREAGRGGMGVVYEAIEIPLNRRVAVKLLDLRVVRNSIALQRFQRESRAAATLHHTNIVPVFAVGEEHGVHFYVMPFIEGETLADFLASLRATTPKPDVDIRRDTDSLAQMPTAIMSKDIYHRAVVPPVQETMGESSCTGTPAPVARPGESNVKETTNLESVESRESLQSQASLKVSIRRAAEIGLQIAEALDHANQHGILHRDIKPSNLMLAEDGMLWVMDFGLARFTESDDLTSTGEILGTPRYLAPERLSGQHTIQGDLYATGMVLYELLTLKSPFNSTDRAELIRQIVTVDPVSPRTLRQDVPKDLETIVLKCLAKEPKDRYQQPADLVTDLQNFLHDRPIASRRASRAELFARWCRRNPGTASLLASILILLSIISVGASLWATSLKKERDIAEGAEKKSRASEKKTTEALIRLEQTDEQHRQDLVRSYLSEMHSSFASGSVGQRLNGIESARKLLDVLPFEKLSAEQKRKLTNAAIASFSLSDLREKTVLPVPSIPTHSVDVHPNFQIIALPGDNHRTIIRWIDGSQPEFELVPPDEKSYVLSHRWFSPCGRWICETMITGQHGVPNELRVWDWREQRIVLHLANSGNGFFHAFDNAGRLLYVGNDLVVEKYDLLTGKRLAASSPRYPNSRLALSADQKLLACLVFGRQPVILDAKTLEPVYVLAGVSHTNCGVWDDEGPDFHFGNREGELVLWKPVDGIHWIEPHRHTAIISEIVVSPDGKYLATTSDNAGSLIQGKDTLEAICSVPGEVLRFSADNGQVAVRREDSIVFYETVPSEVWQSTQHAVQLVSFSPDGAWITTAGHQGVLLLTTNPLTLAGDLGLDECGPVSWHPSGDELATFGMFSHLARWPVQIDPMTKALSIGPPSPVVINPVLSKIGLDDNVPARYEKSSVWSVDGERLYFSDQRHDRIKLLHRATGQTEVIVECPGASRIFISNDERWLVSVSTPSQKMRVWDLASRTCVKELPATYGASFSDDGRWLVVGTRATSALFETGSWKSVHEFPADMVQPKISYDVAFMPGSHLFAAAVSRRSVRLFDANAGSAVADLTYTTDADILSTTFSPDGQRLAIVRTTEVSIWNLGALGAGLNALGIPTPVFPQQAALPENRLIASINRGKDLLESHEWWKGYELLAKFEILQSRYSDAIGALSNAFLIVQRGNDEARWSILTQRATCYLATGDKHSAHADLEEAVRFKPGDVKTSRSLAELQLFGPPALRDPATTESLLQVVCENEGATHRDQIHRVLAKLDHRPHTARIALQQLATINPEDLATADQLLLQLIHAATSAEESGKTTSETISRIKEEAETNDLSEEDQNRLQVACRIATDAAQNSGSPDSM